MQDTLTATARMISLLQDYISPNDHVLEIGTGSGYRAALLATLMGPGGHVTTVELDQTKAHRAHRALVDVWKMAEHRVSVVIGDGTLPGMSRVSCCVVQPPPLTTITWVDPELFGCSNHGPCTPAYNAVLVSAMAPTTPQHLVDLVLPLGVCVMPVGPTPNGPIRLKRLYKVADGAVFMDLMGVVHGVARLATTRGASPIAKRKEL